MLLFRALSGRRDDAVSTEERIWSLWMYHPNTGAARELDRATSDIAAQRWDIAETRLSRLTRRCPDFAEAWNKLATLHYIREYDEECLAALNHTLALEPRHFGAMAGFGEICMGRGDAEGALLAFRAALRIHPGLDAVEQTYARIAAGEIPGRGAPDA